MMRIVWGLYDREQSNFLVLFENQPLAEGYREQLLRPWYDALVATPDDFIPTGDLYEEELKTLYDAAIAERERLLDIGYERWRIDELNSAEPRFYLRKHELWNSVPPNRERLVIQFQAG